MQLLAMLLARMTAVGDPFGSSAMARKPAYLAGQHGDIDIPWDWRVQQSNMSTHLGIWFTLDIELIKPIRPIDFIIFIRNVNTRPSVADEISRLEYGSRGSLSGKFRRAAAIRVFAVDGK